MLEINDEPAFPVYDPVEELLTEGMTLRDYFAAKALASSTGWYLSEINNWDNKERAEWAYNQADEMLKRREE